MARSSITIRDVAAEAGVSHQTVSRVINDNERVSPETRAKVEAAIESLGYSPSAIARSMAKGRTGILACIAPNLTDYTFARIIQGAEQEARQHGFFLLSASAPDEAIFSALIEQLVPSRQTEGIMVINPYADGRFHHLPHQFPTVFAGARPREDAVNSVALDDVATAVNATNYLLQQGHRHIATITGPMAEDCSQDRLAGYQQALQAADVPLPENYVVEGDWQAASGFAALPQLMQVETPPTAIFVQNDQMAAGVIRAAAEMGLAVPEQLSLIGIDDIPMASYLSPPLTTLRQDFAEIGRLAAQLLIEAVNDPNTQQQHLTLPATLVPRHSSVPIL
ncbi:MAG: LacI family DNA-binding transcriptional regulator [Anaerolineales bacterium]|nr:LacI family DNA-binding transcriptional regulator [Anaerolineales bacterium]MCB8936996.1 LacI family DNA-binding transcriptional regulator [Ardenticatenaceae bacterium]